MLSEYFLEIILMAYNLYTFSMWWSNETDKHFHLVKHLKNIFINVLHLHIPMKVRCDIPPSVYNHCLLTVIPRAQLTNFAALFVFVFILVFEPRLYGKSYVAITFYIIHFLK